MLQKILAILIIAAAVAGICISLLKQQKEDPCGGGCSDCPLAKKCTKDEKKL